MKIRKLLERIESMTTCEECKHWDEIEKGYGVCRRNAPHPKMVRRDGEANWDVICQWPITERDDFCGEFASEDGDE